MIKLICSIFISSNYFFIFFFYIYKKCLKIHQINITKVIRKDYRKKHRKRYQNHSTEEKEKKQQYGCEQYKNLKEDEKQKLVEFIIK